MLIGWDEGHFSLKGDSDEKTRFFEKFQIIEETPPKCCIRFSNNDCNLLSPTFQCYYVEILVFHSIRHYWYVACILIRESLERGLMTSLTQHIARCYLSKQWKTEASSFIDHDLSTSELSFDFEQIFWVTYLWLWRFRLVATEEKAAAYRRERAQEKEQEEC